MSHKRSPLYSGALILFWSLTATPWRDWLLEKRMKGKTICPNLDFFLTQIKLYPQCYGCAFGLSHSSTFHEQSCERGKHGASPSKI